MVVATLRDDGWPDGYRVPVPVDAQGHWREIFTSDAELYGGAGVTNEAALEVTEGKLSVKVPARGFVVLRHVPQS
jgi:1,4-alpha-glucan branching enzyme